MFDVGFTEIILIALVALVVLGPERMPKAARFAGLWIRRARAQWYSVKSELERELAAEELQRSLRDTREAARNIEDEIRDAEAAARREFDAVRGGIVPGGAAPSAVDDDGPDPGRPYTTLPPEAPAENDATRDATADAVGDAAGDGTAPVATEGPFDERR